MPGPQNFNLTPGWYALSVNMLYDRSGQYTYFRERFTPVAYAGYSIYIYHLTEADCASVGRPLAR